MPIPIVWLEIQINEINILTKIWRRTTKNEMKLFLVASVNEMTLFRIIILSKIFIFFHRTSVQLQKPAMVRIPSVL